MHDKNEAQKLQAEENSIKVIQVNGPLGLILQQYKIKQKIIAKLARAFGVK